MRLTLKRTNISHSTIIHRDSLTEISYRQQKGQPMLPLTIGFFLSA